MFKSYNKCIFCGSKRLIKEKKQNYLNNFYVKAIKADLKISNSKFNKIKVYKCSKCFILQNNPWFTKEYSKIIYSNIYGQHHRGWSNLINFFQKGKLPNHGSLFDLLQKKIKIKNYAEFNSPFTGIFINFFQQQYIKNSYFYKNLFKNLILYLSSRQVAGKSIRNQKRSLKKGSTYLKKIESLKKKFFIKINIKKFLFVENSSLSWWQNDNYKSVNSKSLASNLFDLKMLEFKEKKQNLKIDLFGIFHSLDHTFEPKKVLDYALNISKYVVVYCHVDSKLNKQHLFSFTKDFLKYLKKNKIYSLDLTFKINKKYKSPELYFLCSKRKKYISKFI